MEIINRKIKPHEYHILLHLLHAAYQSDVELGIHFKVATIDYDNMVKHIKSMQTFVSIYNGKIVATASVRLPWSLNPGPYNVPHLGWVATDPKYLHHGYSSQLIKWIETYYIKNELHSPIVSLGTACEHPWLKIFYQKVGYQKVATERKYDDHLTVYMVKILDHIILNNSSRLNQLGLNSLYEGELKNEL